jgi:hypothetical protein
LDEITAREMSHLREELRDLKGYQFRLIGIAVVITGFLLSLTQFRVDSKTLTITAPLLYLLPLIIVIPSWFIFFDKARTVTRIVGYCRHLEAFLRHEHEPAQFPGWERALGIYRKECPRIVHDLRTTPRWRKHFKSSLRRFATAASLRRGQPYWVLAYYTFLSLSAACIGIPIWWRFRGRAKHLLYLFVPHYWNAGAFLLFLAVLVTCFCAILNGLILAELIWGQHSYDFEEDIWKRILSA